MVVVVAFAIVAGRFGATLGREGLKHWRRGVGGDKKRVDGQR